MFRKNNDMANNYTKGWTCNVLQHLIVWFSSRYYSLLYIREPKNYQHNVWARAFPHHVWILFCRFPRRSSNPPAFGNIGYQEQREDPSWVPCELDKACSTTFHANMCMYFVLPRAYKEKRVCNYTILRIHGQGQMSKNRQWFIARALYAL